MAKHIQRRFTGWLRIGMMMRLENCFFEIGNSIQSCHKTFQNCSANIQIEYSHAQKWLSETEIRFFIVKTLTLSFSMTCCCHSSFFINLVANLHFVKGDTFFPLLKQFPILKIGIIPHSMIYTSTAAMRFKWGLGGFVRSLEPHHRCHFSVGLTPWCCWSLPALKLNGWANGDKIVKKWGHDH